MKERLWMLLACTDLDTADTAARGLLGITVVAADLPEARRLWETINDWWAEIETFIETRVTNVCTEARTPRSSAPDAATATTGTTRPYIARHAGYAHA